MQATQESTSQRIDWDRGRVDEFASLEDADLNEMLDRGAQECLAEIARAQQQFHGQVRYAPTLEQLSQNFARKLQRAS